VSVRLTSVLLGLDWTWPDANSLMTVFLTRLILLLAISIAFAIPLSGQTFTFSGRVTEQSNGKGISGAVVVAEGNATGTRVAARGQVSNGAKIKLK